MKNVVWTGTIDTREAGEVTARVYEDNEGRLHLQVLDTPLGSEDDDEDAVGEWYDYDGDSREWTPCPDDTLAVRLVDAGILDKYQGEE